MLPDDRVVVAGSATREIEPDGAVWRLGVQERASDARVCFENCAARQAALVARLRDERPDDEVVTTAIELRSDHRYEAREAPTFVAAAQVRVTIDPGGSAALLAQASGSGVDEVHGPQLLVSQAAVVRRELLRDAVEDGRSRAEALASGAGRALGRVVSIEERSGSRYDEDEDDVVAVRAVAAAGGTEFELPVRRLQISAHVRVSFELT